MTESRIHVGDLKPGDIALLKDLADQAAKMAVKEMLITMGLDPMQPLAAQRDLAWLRATRERSEGIWGKAVATLVALVIIGATSAFWIGVQSFLQKPHP